MCGIMESSNQSGADPNPVCLLDLAAANDLCGFTQAIKNGARVDESASWYSRQHGTNRMASEQRTPAMIAALYGSLDVLGLVLNYYKALGLDINRGYGSDGSTALHCATMGASAEAVHKLLRHGARVDALDAHNRRPADMITPPLRTKSALEALIMVGNPSLLEQLELESEEEGSCLLPTSSSYVEDAGGRCSDNSSSPTLITLPSPLLSEPLVDVSLPNIKNNIYTTDEFRMYSFKVRPCSRAYSHDWTECPFVHPGENARRRDPRKHHYSCVPCPDFRKGGGTCTRGDKCEYAHGVFECWLHPAHYRTRLCKDGPGCARRVCFFAHKTEELRPLQVSTISSLDVSPFASPPASPSSVLVPSPFSTQPLPSPSPLGLLSSRLRSSLSARDMVPQNLSDCVGSQSPSIPSKFRNLGLHLAPTNLDDLFASEVASTPSHVQSTFVQGVEHKHSNGSRDLGTGLLSDWGSPTGKPEWAIKGEDLLELRKSALFGERKGLDKPNLSWVEKIVKDGSVDVRYTPTSICPLY